MYRISNLISNIKTLASDRSTLLPQRLTDIENHHVGSKPGLISQRQTSCILVPRIGSNDRTTIVQKIIDNMLPCGRVSKINLANRMLKHLSIVSD
jgi:hypothetical protein